MKTNARSQRTECKGMATEKQTHMKDNKTQKAKERQQRNHTKEQQARENKHKRKNKKTSKERKQLKENNGNGQQKEGKGRKHHKSNQGPQHTWKSHTHKKNGTDTKDRTQRHVQRKANKGKNASA